MSASTGSTDRSTAVVIAGAVGLGTAVTLLIGFVRSSLSPPTGPGGAGGFVVSVALGAALLTFAVVYGRQLAPPDLLRRTGVSALFGLAGGTFSFTLVSMLSGTFHPDSVPPWVVVLGVALALGAFVFTGTRATEYWG